MRLSETGLTVLHDADFDDLGLLGTTGLGYLTDAKYAPKVKGPVITTLALARECRAERGVIVVGPTPYPDYDQSAAWARRYVADVERIGTFVDNPETAFWALHERLVAQGFYPKRENVIGCDSRIHPQASVGQWDVGIHRGRGFITNAGYVRIGERVTIGAHSAVDRSVWKEPTTIDDDTQIDNLVHVAHNVQIGKRCTIIAGTVLGGSCVIEDDCFLGIGVHVRPGVRIGKGSFIGMSVSVLDDVPAGGRLTCRSR